MASWLDVIVRKGYGAILVTWRVTVTSLRVRKKEVECAEKRLRKRSGGYAKQLITGLERVHATTSREAGPFHRYCGHARPRKVIGGTRSGRCLRWPTTNRSRQQPSNRFLFCATEVERSASATVQYISEFLNCVYERMLALRVCVSVARSILPVRRPRSAVLDWRMAETHKRNGKHATSTYSRLHMLVRNTKANESVPAIPCSLRSCNLHFFIYVYTLVPSHLIHNLGPH